MDNILFQSYLIEDRSYVAFIKREIHNLIKPWFNVNRAAQVDIVISELTSNIIKHAQKGEVLYRLQVVNELPCLEVICIDNGPGIKDIANAMKDGFSTKHTLGQGIGSIMRLSNFAQFYTQPGWGTIVYTVFCHELEFIPPKSPVLIRCINLAKTGERVSGDGISVRHFKHKTLIFAGDGLGHGQLAKDAVDKAIHVFENSMSGDPSELIRELNRGIKQTRGIVATVAMLDHEKKEWQICGVGNISTRMQKGLDSKNYIGNNGIIGYNIPNRLENSIYEMEKLQQLILCSDGIKTRWDLMKYPSILKYDPMIMAAIIYKDHCRKTDDTTILIAKVV